MAKAGQVFFAHEDARADVQHEPDHLTGLSDTGWTEARELGVRLCAAFGSFDRVFHSGYRRTRETTEGLLEAWPADERARIDVRHHLLLRERDAGYAFNMTAAEAKAAFPWLQPHWDLFGHLFARPPGGESLADVAARVDQFFQALARAIVGKRILIVTHFGTLQMARFLIEGWTHDEVIDRLRREPVSNCGGVAYRLDRQSGRLARSAEFGTTND